MEGSHESKGIKAGRITTEAVRSGTIKARSNSFTRKRPSDKEMKIFLIAVAAFIASYIGAIIISIATS